MYKIDYKQLKKRCRQNTGSIINELGGNIVNCGLLNYAYKDNNSNVLAVAHLDTVIQSNEVKSITMNGNKITFTPMLDDRLGVYTIMDFLPSLGINMDILLTDGEESGRSTASWFEENKTYNWIVEFDRKGDDVVTYQYNWDKTLKGYFKLGYGSYSDIADLDFLGCKALNVGIGYHNEHTSMCYMVDNEYLSQMVRFIKFYREQANTHHPYIPQPKYNYGHDKPVEYSFWDSWDTDEETELGGDDAIYQCPYCLDLFYESQALLGNGVMNCPECGLGIKDYKMARTRL